MSQKWVQKILNDFYGTDGLHGYGYGQDEDQGQLGAWYVMSSMGLFDVKGLTEINPKFQVGSPLFDRITIQLNQDYFQGQKFVIETKNISSDNSYIETITLNGKKQDSILIPFKEVVNGGKLVIELNSSPNLKLEK